MSRLAPNLFDRRYADLVQLGRSRLPSCAPAWTDHNAHDPGITLIELLAWVAEAQIYSLSKTRRDERQAYSALMGVEPHGARPASGLIWPDHGDPAAPSATIFRGRIIDPDSAIRLERAETPSFRPIHRQVWIPARIKEIKTRLSDGTMLDHSDANLRGGPAFRPFGADEGRDAVLRMMLEATGADPLFEPGRAKDARLIVGVRAVAAAPVGKRTGTAPAETPVEVTLVAGGHRIPLPVVEDTTDRMLRTGFIALDASLVDIQPNSVVLEFRNPAGFARSPHLIRIEPNVVPVIQRTPAAQTENGDGSPDQAFDLDTPGLEFEPGSDPVKIEVELSGKVDRWSKTDDLSACGPEDRKFELDPVAARITFGNGVNGARPPAGSNIHASYSATEGQVGNIAANRKWVVSGFLGAFGVNTDPTTGGQEATDWKAQRRDARRALRETHALVSARDFEGAARGLAGLEVGRAWMMPPSDGDIATGTMRLVAMRSRLGAGESNSIPETRRWLESIRRNLESRVALGSRLRVIAPRYVTFSVTAVLEAEPMKDPEDVRREAIKEIEARLTLVNDKPNGRQRSFGMPVSRRDLTAWLQALPDVRRVIELSIRLSDGGKVEDVQLPANGLPRFDPAQSDIKAIRSGSGYSS